MRALIRPVGVCKKSFDEKKMCFISLTKTRNSEMKLQSAGVERLAHDFLVDFLIEFRYVVVMLSLRHTTPWTAQLLLQKSKRIIEKVKKLTSPRIAPACTADMSTIVRTRRITSMR